MFEYIQVFFKDTNRDSYFIKEADYYIQDGILTIFKKSHEIWRNPNQLAYRNYEINILMREVACIETKSRLVVEDKNESVK